MKIHAKGKGKGKGKGCLALASLALAALTVGATEWHPLNSAEQAALGATHVLTINKSDLTAAGVHQYLTGVVFKAQTAVVPVAAVLVQPFKPSGAAANNSLTFDIGTQDSTNKYFALWQVSSNTVPAWVMTKQSLTNEPTPAAKKVVKAKKVKKAAKPVKSAAAPAKEAPKAAAPAPAASK